MLYIPINKLCPHPMNPRKDLGDMTELAESIKQRGVMQNLTVVPVERGYCKNCSRLNKYTVRCDDGHKEVVAHRDEPCPHWELGSCRNPGEYTVVIGNRRFAAAKLAGLTELPCVVVDMTEHEQVATMLLENMQRADLTVYEQTQGFQMMINFGETLHNIAEKTGFSETTIRRRVKLLELDADKFRKSANRNVTLMEYAELEKIENIELRNKVLDAIGTSNFRYELQKALDSEKKAKWFSSATEEVESFAIRVPEQPKDSRYITSYYFMRDEKIKRPEDVGSRKYYFTASDSGYITLYGESLKEDENTADIEKMKKERATYGALTQITDRAYRLRHDFVLELSNSIAKKSIGLIIENTIRAIMGNYGILNYEDFANMHNVTIPDDGNEDIDNLIDDIHQCPEKSLLIAIFLYMDGSNRGYHTWNNQYKENKELERIYDMLIALGYEMSDEEKALRDGTHELLQEEF